MVGFDLGTHSIKIVEGSFASSKPSIRSMASFPLPFDLYVEGQIRNEETFVQLLKEIRQKLKLGNKKICLSLSSKGTIVRKFDLPYTQLDDLHENLVFEIEQYLPFSIQDAQIDFQVLRSSPKLNRTEILFAGLQKNIVEQLKVCFEEAELNLKCLELGVLSQANFLQKFYDRRENVMAVIDCGASWTHLAVFENFIPIYTRDLQIGGLYLTKEIARRLNLNNFEAEVLKQSLNKDSPGEVIEILNYMADNLANEIKRSIDFYNAQKVGSAISKIYVTGGCAKIPGLSKIISEVTGIHLEPINPFLKIKLKNNYPDEYVTEMVPITVNACGAALRK